MTQWERAQAKGYGRARFDAGAHPVFLKAKCVSAMFLSVYLR